MTRTMRLPRSDHRLHDDPRPSDTDPRRVELLADMYDADGRAGRDDPRAVAVRLSGADGRISGTMSTRTAATASCLARCSGTFGSGGAFEPMIHEVDDAADTVAWMRDQPWFDGRFATSGGSYLGFTQWALLVDPPPELVTAVISIGPHDFHAAAYQGGAFNLNDFLGWSNQVARQEDYRLRAQHAAAGADATSRRVVRSRSCRSSMPASA